MDSVVWQVQIVKVTTALIKPVILIRVHVMMVYKMVKRVIWIVVGLVLPVMWDKYVDKTKTV